MNREEEKEQPKKTLHRSNSGMKQPTKFIQRAKDAESATANVTAVKGSLAQAASFTD